MQSQRVRIRSHWRSALSCARVRIFVERPALQLLKHAASLCRKQVVRRGDVVVLVEFEATDGIFSGVSCISQFLEDILIESKLSRQEFSWPS